MATRDLRSAMWYNVAVIMSFVKAYLITSVHVCTIRMTTCVEQHVVLQMHLTYESFFVCLNDEISMVSASECVIGLVR